MSAFAVVATFVGANAYFVYRIQPSGSLHVATDRLRYDAWRGGLDRGVRPLEKMSLSSGKHVFVVVGRLRDSVTERPPSTGELDYTTWGPDAVVCDPWDYKAFPATQMRTEMVHGETFSASAHYRLEL